MDDANVTGNGLPANVTGNGNANGNVTGNGLPAPLADDRHGIFPSVARHAAKQQRKPNGHFAKGNRLASHEHVNKFVELCRALVNKHHLVHEACLMATGRGQYEKCPPAERLKAIEFVTNRAYGRPHLNVTMDASEQIQFSQRVAYVKRLVGIDEGEI